MNNLEKDQILSTEAQNEPQEVVSEEVKVEEPATEEPKAEEPVAEEPKAEEPVAEEAVAEETAAPEEPAPKLELAGKTKSELVEMMRTVAARPIEEVKDEVQAIKAAFFALRREETAQEKEAFLANGNEESDFTPKEDADENDLKELLNVLKERRTEYNAAQEANREANLEKKRQIIVLINEIANDPDNINRQFNRVKQLQQEFKDAGEVPATADTEIWKEFQRATERFYDVLKMNKELRDYDFKKNLELKQQLCEEAEALDEETDIVAAFRKLQELHNNWREIGPVAKELREELWARFKAASSAINKKYQTFFEDRKSKEKENADAKTELCEKIEQISTDNLKTYAQWDEVTKQIIALQEDWKKLGYASRKANAALFARFRKSCDEFFAKKAEFYKNMKEELSSNLAKKIDLCERAEALMDSTDWKEATDKFVEMQKEWKTIGPVVKKYSDNVWKRFIAACDHFFEEKKKQNVNVHAVEHDNLKAKKEVIANLKATIEEAAEDAAQTVRDLMDRWQEIGHVPFKEKDKIYAQYRELVDKAFETLNMRGSRPRGDGGSRGPRLSGGDRNLSERDRLVRTYEQRMSELKTFENNMGFLTANTKSGNSLVQEMERRIAKLKEEIAELEQKIKELDNA
ncbi:MAG: DUF349 domain-containing protein [Muribaculaceae bacterium]|nr:DUF349 domain-containing protein [Bacteroidales bacterium]MBQ1487097.1 DUF349 domain-containing protein [Muribaculaceae bacterium]MBR3728995.1 DUF349 domain-containing protein [Muribaculaceae bacterium]